MYNINSYVLYIAYVPKYIAIFEVFWEAGGHFNIARRIIILHPMLTRSRGSGAPGVKSYKKVKIFVHALYPLN